MAAKVRNLPAPRHYTVELDTFAEILAGELARREFDPEKVVYVVDRMKAVYTRMLPEPVRPHPDHAAAFAAILPSVVELVRNANWTVLTELALAYAEVYDATRTSAAAERILEKK